MKFLLFLSLLSFSANVAVEPNDVLFALEAGDASKLESLLKEDPDKLNQCYEIGKGEYCLLSVAIKTDGIQCLNKLIELKADLNKVCSTKTPLMYCAKYGKLKMAKALVEAGADLTIENNGKTALDYAKNYEQKELYDYLSSL